MKKKDIGTLIFLIATILSWGLCILAAIELYQLYTEPRPY